MKKKIAAILMTVLTLLILTSTIPPARAQFVFAGWDWPDEYYQGIKNIKIYENSTGSWVQHGGYYEYTNSNIIDWPVHVGIKLEVFTSVNKSLTGAVTPAECALFVRHNITVTNSAGNIVFSLENLTYDTGADYGPYFILRHSVVLNFLPQYNTVYKVILTCEVFY